MIAIAETSSPKVKMTMAAGVVQESAGGVADALTSEITDENNLRNL